MSWDILFPAGPHEDVRAALTRWLSARPDPPPQGALRLDLIRSDGGDLLRVMVDTELLRGSGAGEAPDGPRDLL